MSAPETPTIASLQARIRELEAALEERDAYIELLRTIGKDAVRDDVARYERERLAELRAHRAAAQAVEPTA